jgi:integrase/recombinase XerC
MNSNSASDFNTVFEDYKTWLTKQPLSHNTRRTYLTQVRQYCDYLAQTPTDYGDLLQDRHARDYAVRDYKAHLKTVRKRKPNTVNLALAAIDHFYSFLKADPARVQREDLPQQAPRSLNEEEQKQFLRAVERTASIRDQALAQLLFYTGIRVGECAALEVEDITISARKGRMIIRQGKRDTYREIPLNAEVRKALKAWQKEREQRFPTTHNTAYFLSRQGKRLSTRAIDLIIRKLGQEANISLSAHILRHTCITNLVRNGIDLVMVAEIAGHRRLETTRRYSLPTAEDRVAAMESLNVEY